MVLLAYGIACYAGGWLTGEYLVPHVVDWWEARLARIARWANRHSISAHRGR